MIRRGACLALLLTVVCALAAPAGAAEAKRSWRAEKCFRYGRDWNEALRRFSRAGLSPQFIDGVAAFIGSDCASLDKICPRTAKDREFVDILAIRVVNEGMSTTFLPFGCPHSP